MAGGANPRTFAYFSVFSNYAEKYWFAPPPSHTATDSPAFLTVIPNKSGRLIVTVIEAEGGGRGGGGGGGGALASINNR